MGEATMIPDQQVVGYDPDTGRSVIGYDPNTGKAVYQSAQPKPAPSKDTFLTSLGRTIIPTPIGGVPGQVLANTLPAVGAGVATATTGGLAAIPLAATGGAIGQMAKDTTSGEDLSMRDRLWNMGEAGLTQAVVQGVGSAVPVLAGKVASGARSLWNRAAKITEPVAKKTQTMRAGGTLQQGKEEIAETVLSQGKGTIRQGNAEALQNQLNKFDDEVDTIVSNSKGLVSRQELRQAIQTQKASIERGSHEAETTIAALDESLKLLNHKPAKMTVATAQAFKRQIYKSWEKTFSADAAQSARASADKVVARAARAGIAREEPAVAPLNEQMSKVIPAASAMNKAVSRTSNHNIVGLSQMMAGMVPNKATVVSALINHPKVGSFTAQQLYNAAAKLPKDARTASNIIRMAGVLMSSGRER